MPAASRVAGDDADEAGWFTLAEMEQLPMPRFGARRSAGDLLGLLPSATVSRKCRATSQNRLAADKLFRHKGLCGGLHLSSWHSLAVPMALARPAAAVEAPFDAGLMRLAEVLGSLHFLRNLCGEKGDQWRRTDGEAAGGRKPGAGAAGAVHRQLQPRLPLVRGIYISCTASATEAIGRYMKEGEALTRDIAARYGN